LNKAEQKELERSSELSDKGKHAEAISRLEILETSADREVHDMALNYLADAYAATGRNADAEAMLRRSIGERGGTNEGLGSQLAALAVVVRRQGRDEEAEELYLRALDEQRPDGPEIKAITSRNMAYLYWTTGRRELALELLDRVPECNEGFLDFLTGVMKPYIEPEIPV